jgi:hypothetical protein
MSETLHDRIFEHPLFAPLVVAIGLTPFVVEMATASNVPTVPLVGAAVLVVVGTGIVALGLPRLAAATLVVGVTAAVEAVDVATPVTADTVVLGLLVVALGLLGWSIRVGEGQRLRTLAERSSVREME